MDDVRNGIIPVRGHALIISLDEINHNKNDKKYGKSKWRLNRPCTYIPGLPTCQIFLNLRDYHVNYDPRGYRLARGDVIKIGDKKIKVLAITPNPKKLLNRQSLQSQSEPQDPHYYRYSPAYYLHPSNPPGTCRICLNDSTQPNDYMLTPCQCKGSCATVHYECLREWFVGKVVPINDRWNDKVSTYRLKELTCEICKTSMPTAILTPQNVFTPLYLFNLKQRPQSSTLTLQIQDDSILYQLSLKNGQVIHIGRSLTMDLTLWHHYISKVHASISCQNNQFYLKDCNSEYGTYVELKKNIQEIKGVIQLEIQGVGYKFEEGESNIRAKETQEADRRCSLWRNC